MNSAATLAWHPPVALRIARDGSIVPAAPIESIPPVPGMYLFARNRNSRLEPLYVGLASRSLRQRFVQQLRSPRMYEGLRVARGGKRFFGYAELTGVVGDCRQVLGSAERELIRLATVAGFATLNTHQKRSTPGLACGHCTLNHEGFSELWWWSPAEVTAALKPLRRNRRSIEPDSR